MDVMEICNLLHDPSRRIFVLSKREDINLIVLNNVIKRINELKKLTKLISCDCKWKFDGRKYNSNQKWNNSNCRFEC